MMHFTTLQQQKSLSQSNHKISIFYCEIELVMNNGRKLTLNYSEMEIKSVAQD